ncbi:hypothetical protein [Streptomyces sp. NPDC048623]|uniref:hypothetical protein n=1 Tax=Streptomyces sp. NPDC048623 TaxID=3155761 RepID=UPI0034369798
MIVAVGHIDLSGAARAAVEAELSARLAELPAGQAGLVRAGRGIPALFARAAKAAGHRLVVTFPAGAAAPEELPPRDRLAAGDLLALADEVRLLAYDPADRDACVCADEQLVKGCRHLIAVWDGSPSNGKDATAHLVAYALARGIPVDVVWPDHVRREAAAPTR